MNKFSKQKCEFRPQLRYLTRYMKGRHCVHHLFLCHFVIRYFRYFNKHSSITSFVDVGFVITDKDLFRAIMENQDLVATLPNEEFFRGNKPLLSQLGEHMFTNIFPPH